MSRLTPPTLLIHTNASGGANALWTNERTEAHATGMPNERRTVCTLHSSKEESELRTEAAVDPRISHRNVPDGSSFTAVKGFK